MFSYQVYTLWGELLIFLSILLFFIILTFESFVNISTGNSLYHVISEILPDLDFWFKIFFVTLMFPLIDIMYSSAKMLYKDVKGISYDQEDFDNLSQPL